LGKLKVISPAKQEKYMTKCAIAFGVILLAATSAFGQIDASSLRSKYGAPLDRETFMVRPGIEMVVDYGSGKQVCQIELPSGDRIVGSVPAGVVTKQQVDEVLNEVVPPSVRGKEINRGLIYTGAPMFSFTDYEHISTGELQVGGIGKGITVTFKDPACPKKTVQ
jgi:hypothetical protein